MVVRTDTVPAGRNDPQNFLTGVTATGLGDVWASGYEGNVNQQNFSLPYVLHWNGTAWSLTGTPNAGTEGSLLAGVIALSPTDVWVAGQTGESDGALPTFTEHFNGAGLVGGAELGPGRAWRRAGQHVPGDHERRATYPVRRWQPGDADVLLPGGPGRAEHHGLNRKLLAS